jgi:hypothetical protein
MSGDIFGSNNSGDATDIYWVEDRDAAKHHNAWDSPHNRVFQPQMPTELRLNSLCFP